MSRFAQVDDAAVERALVALGWTGSVRWCCTFSERLFGMTAMPSVNKEGLSNIAVFPQCSSVHTAFMSFPIDIAFIDERGRVLALHEGVGPWRLVNHASAQAVIERTSFVEGETACPQCPVFT